MWQLGKGILIAGCVLTISLLAPEIHASARGEDAVFQEADKNKNSTLDEKEFRAHLISVFDSLDLNDDGVLTSSECEHGCVSEKYIRDPQAYADYLFSAINRDGNNVVDEAEYLSYMDGKFQLHDRNQNKSLEESEFYAFYHGKDQRNFIAKKTLAP